MKEKEKEGEQEHWSVEGERGPGAGVEGGGHSAGQGVRLMEDVWQATEQKQKQETTGQQELQEGAQEVGGTVGGRGEEEALPDLCHLPRVWCLLRTGTQDTLAD